MKASLQAALRHIDANFAPAASDAFLVAPADMPRLSAAIINRLLDEHYANPESAILVPTLRGRRGHPVLFPWSFGSRSTWPCSQRRAERDRRAAESPADSL